MIHTVNGSADPEFRPIVKVFQKQLEASGGGAALCVYHKGEPVIDIWAGQRTSMGDPWLKDTPAMSFSVTKGVLATMLHIIMDRTQLDYETQASSIWPSFKQNNKGHLTIRQFLCHEAGLFSLEDNIDHIHDIFDWDQMVWRIAKAKPAMNHLGEPSYHAVTYGWLLGELINRLTGQKPGEFLNAELRSVMGRNNFIGVPEKNLKDVAFIYQHPDQAPVQLGWKQKVSKYINKGIQNAFFHSPFTASALKPPTAELLDFNNPELLKAQVPAMNGVFTARGLGKLYNAIITPDEKNERLISTKRLEQVQVIQSHGRDKIIHVPMNWRLGYHRVLNMKTRAPQGFGHYGYGGAGAWCDPSRQLAVGFTHNALWNTPLGDYRMTQLSGEILSLIDKITAKENRDQFFL